MIAPAMTSEKGVINQNPNSSMGKRVGFKLKEVRKEFFSLVKKSLGFKTWGEVWTYFSLPKTTFQEYQYGMHLIPENVFSKFSAVLSNADEIIFQEKIYFKPDNWGSVKGGKELARKYPEEMRKRRINGIKKLRALGFGVAKEIDSSQSLSKEFCEFVGAFMGDGFFDAGKSLGISGDSELDREYHNYLSKNVGDLFDLKGRIYKSKEKNSSYLKFNSTELCKMFVNRFGFPNGPKAYSVKIPKEILLAKKEFLFSTIRGIFDTDGCVYFDKRKSYSKPYPRISLCIKSKPLSDQLYEILSEDFRVYKIKNNRGDQGVEIYGREQIRKWVDLIGFSNPRHLNKLNF